MSLKFFLVNRQNFFLSANILVNPVWLKWWSVTCSWRSVWLQFCQIHFAEHGFLILGKFCGFSETGVFTLKCLGPSNCWSRLSLVFLLFRRFFLWATSYLIDLHVLDQFLSFIVIAKLYNCKVVHCSHLVFPRIFFFRFLSLFTFVCFCFLLFFVPSICLFHYFVIVICCLFVERFASPEFVCFSGHSIFRPTYYPIDVFQQR